MTNVKYNSRATIGPPAKLHLNGVSLVGRRWSAGICLVEYTHSTAKCKALSGVYGDIKNWHVDRWHVPCCAPKSVLSVVDVPISVDVTRC